MTTQIEPVDRAAIAQIVIDELRAEPQRLLPESLLRLPDVVDQLAGVVAQLAEGQRVLMEGQRVIVAEQRAQGARLDALEEGQRAIVAEQRALAEGQRVIVAEQRAQGARLDALEEGQRAIVAEQQVLAEGQRVIVAEQRAQGARLDALEEGQRAIVAEQQVLAEGQRVIVSEQRAQGARLDALEEGQRAIVAEQQAIIAEQQVLAEGQQSIITEQQAIIAEQRDMAARMIRIENDLASVKGWGLELLCARRPGMVGRRLDLARVRTVDPGEVAEMADDARHNGTITRAEHDQIIRADVIYHGLRDSDRIPCYAVLEVSYVVDINDVRRAMARANLLSRITGMDAVSAVAGDRITEGARTAAETRGGVSDVANVIYVHVQNGAQLRS